MRRRRRQLYDNSGYDAQTLKNEIAQIHFRYLTT